jgi:hypothetical protein
VGASANVKGGGGQMDIISILRNSNRGSDSENTRRFQPNNNNNDIDAFFDASAGAAYGSLFTEQEPHVAERSLQLSSQGEHSRFSPPPSSNADVADADVGLSSKGGTGVGGGLDGATKSIRQTCSATAVQRTGVSSRSGKSSAATGDTSFVPTSNSLDPEVLLRSLQNYAGMYQDMLHNYTDLIRRLKQDDERKQSAGYIPKKPTSKSLCSLHTLLQSINLF